MTQPIPKYVVAGLKRGVPEHMAMITTHAARAPALEHAILLTEKYLQEHLVLEVTDHTIIKVHSRSRD